MESSFLPSTTTENGQVFAPERTINQTIMIFTFNSPGLACTESSETSKGPSFGLVMTDRSYCTTTYGTLVNLNIMQYIIHAKDVCVGWSLPPSGMDIKHMLSNPQGDL